jgi:flagellin-like hook-associated protein FlgL
MSRINTNVSSLIAQKTLARSQTSLQTSLTRLSTGLRINVGKDDPAGLIASESLRSDITATQKAITNSERANQLIGTADSALGQVSSLLNDIRGLVSEAANTGALSPDQIAANQLQLDSSLEAIDRIAQITSFQGRKLLDGSLDFITTGLDNSKVEGLRIDQANFGTQTSIGVSVNVVKQATRGQLNYGFGAIAGNVVLEIGGANGTEAFNFAKGSTIEEIASAVNLVSDATGVEAVVEKAAQKGTATISSFGDNNDITLTANQAGFEPGNIRVKYSEGGTGSTTATYTAASGDNPATLDVALQTQAYTAASVTIDPAGADNKFNITANLTGADFNGVTVDIVNDGALTGGGDEYAAFDYSTKKLTVSVKAGTSTAADIVDAINNAGTADNSAISALFTAALDETVGGTGAGTVAAGVGVGTFAGGVDGGAIIATANDVIAAINSATGNDQVTASLATGNDGHGVVTAFDYFAFSGKAEANNRLQFLSPESTPSIKFASNAGQSLGIDTSSKPRIEGNSTTTLQSKVANQTFTVSAKLKGTDWDGYSVSIVDDSDVVAANNNEFAVLDKENKTLTIHIDDTNSNTNDILGAINNDEYISQFFSASNFGSSTGAAAITLANSGFSNNDTAGGLVDAGTLVINLETDENGIVKTTANDLIKFFNDPSQFISDNTEAAAALAELTARGISVSNAEGSDGSGVLEATTSDISFATKGTKLENGQATGGTNAVNGLNAELTFTAVKAGADFDNVTVNFEDDATVTAGTDEFGVYDANTKTLTFHIDAGNTTAQHIKDIFNSADANYDASLAAKFTADFTGAGNGTGLVTSDDTAKLTGGVVDNGTVDGTTLLGNSDLADQGLTFRATNFGSDSFVSVKALSGTFKLTDENHVETDRSVGTDVDARINGIQAIGKGLKASLNTASLDLSFSVNSSVADGQNLNFNITGGGALFQLGPKVVSNQQARLGIQSVSTATLGGVNGRLFELRSGGSKALDKDTGGAAKVVDEVISVVTQLRGRLGAFQKTTLETNIYTLNDTLANLTEAESSIRDADFAAESASLTRAQILVQSGTSVLGIANQNPQNVLSLLR